VGAVTGDLELAVTHLLQGESVPRETAVSIKPDLKGKWKVLLGAKVSADLRAVATLLSKLS
jgi:hypothetical protein